MKLWTTLQPDIQAVKNHFTDTAVEKYPETVENR